MLGDDPADCTPSRKRYSDASRNERVMGYSTYRIDHLEPYA